MDCIELPSHSSMDLVDDHVPSLSPSPSPLPSPTIMGNEAFFVQRTPSFDGACMQTAPFSTWLMGGSQDGSAHLDMMEDVRATSGHDQSHYHQHEKFHFGESDFGGGAAFGIAADDGHLSDGYVSEPSGSPTHCHDGAYGTPRSGQDLGVPVHEYNEFCDFPADQLEDDDSEGSSQQDQEQEAQEDQDEQEAQEDQQAQDEQEAQEALGDASEPQTPAICKGMPGDLPPLPPKPPKLPPRPQHTKSGSVLTKSERELKKHVTKVFKEENHGCTPKEVLNMVAANPKRKAPSARRKSTRSGPKCDFYFRLGALDAGKRAFKVIKTELQKLRRPHDGKVLADLYVEERRKLQNQRSQAKKREAAAEEMYETQRCNVQLKRAIYDATYALHALSRMLH
ncbi:hypothetical protein PTSG_01795 [Salpingoeca rosetta]|uniref:Uncharacterized protein n=1 Tax=Salpingoeca rosetta (strain ATCC 50818 / BSB-021) TaxID=946362 RepID=F2TYZ6_SALR5|nr:uncharacterized protein PTSG_01795 [Salpingoeca rosetta]EGD78820.1 hypothetical protein PTSG_01795 [Salpingoeca rosetta]|eukprot:XP_004997776.1 hypothetical protein PTSG_01795 [Salpingoeca rosetta]